MAQSIPLSLNEPENVSNDNHAGNVAEPITIAEPNLVPLPFDVIEPAPAHLMVIPDGHRRWAKSSGMSATDAYVRGANVGIEFVRQFLRSELTSTLTFFLLSPHTLRRPVREIEAIFVGLDRFLRRLSLLCLHTDCRVISFGDLNQLPRSVRTTVSLLNRDIQDFPPAKTINLLLYYSGTLALHTPAAFCPADDIRLSAIDRVYRAAGCVRLSDAPVRESLGASLHLSERMFPTLSPNSINLAFNAWPSRGRPDSFVSRFRIASLEAPGE